MSETRKAPDYSLSAENLVNPPEIGIKLAELHEAERIAHSYESLLEKEDLFILAQSARKNVEDVKAEIKVMIDELGSYQDVESGLYAVKYRRISKSYDAQAFKDHYEKYAPAVIEETVNVASLSGLIKGGLLTEDDLRYKRVLLETVNYAYVVR